MLVAGMSKMERACFVLQPLAVRMNKAARRLWYVRTCVLIILATSKTIYVHTYVCTSDAGAIIILIENICEDTTLKYQLQIPPCIHFLYTGIYSIPKFL